MVSSIIQFDANNIFSDYCFAWKEIIRKCDKQIICERDITNQRKRNIAEENMSLSLYRIQQRMIWTSERRG